jgi:hypothetical protein
METKVRLALQHIESGLFLSWSPDNYPHTRKIDQARRFYSMDELATFLEVSPYKPDEPAAYEIVSIKITYELEVSEYERDKEPVSKN